MRGKSQLCSPALHYSALSDAIPKGGGDSYSMTDMMPFMPGTLAVLQVMLGRMDLLQEACRAST